MRLLKNAWEIEYFRSVVIFICNIIRSCWGSISHELIYNNANRYLNTTNRCYERYVIFNRRHYCIFMNFQWFLIFISFVAKIMKNIWRRLFFVTFITLFLFHFFNRLIWLRKNKRKLYTLKFAYCLSETVSKTNHGACVYYDFGTV